MKRYIEKIFKYINRATVCLLCFAFTFSLCGCVETPPTVQNGILVTPSVIPPYDSETNEYAEEIIFDMLEGYFQRTVMEELPDATVQTLKLQAENIQKITADAPLTEEQYLDCMRFLEENAERYVDALARVEKEESEEEDFATLKQAYMGLANKMGSGVLGSIVYKFCVYRYEYEYEKAMERFEKYGYAYLKAEAEAFAADKKTLEECVGEENFISVMQTVFLLSDLFFGGAFENGQISTFSDHEILALLQEPSIDSITVNDEGWALLLKYLTAFASNENYEGKLLLKANKNGDLAAFSTQMDGAVKLLSSIQNKLTVQEAALLRQNEGKKVLSDIFANFGETEWSLFESLTNVELQTADYETIARSYYGEAFESYCAAVERSSLNELKTAVGTDGFLEVLEGYIAGITPALSYGLAL